MRIRWSNNEPSHLQAVRPVSLMLGEVSPGLGTGTPSPSSQPGERHVAAALSRFCTMAALVLLACLALLGVPDSAHAGEQPAWLKKDTVDRLFPQAASTGPLTGKPPAIPVHGAGGRIGFIFSTAELTDVVGFSGAPFNFVVGLDMQGNITGVVLVEHTEPIIDYNSMGAQLTRFIEQYTGLDLGGSFTLASQGTPGGINGISGATVSARAFNHAIVQAARLVARSRGLTTGAASAAMIDTASFQPLTWPELIAAGAIQRTLMHDGGIAGTDSPDVALELHVAALNPPSIGRNLLGPMRYGEHVAPYGPQDLIVLLMGKGPYSFVGTKVFDTGTFDRVRIEQGTRTFVLKRELKNYVYLPFVSAKEAPKFDEIGLFRVPAESGIDVLAPWQVVIVMGGGNGSSTPTREFKLSYSLPTRFVLPPAEPFAEEPLEAPWRESWRAQAGNLVVLGIGLLLLTALLIAMDRLTRHARFYEAVRIGFLLFTLVWIGWIAGGQLSIINVFAWLHGLINGNGLAVLLADPLLFVLLAFVLVSFVIWGRGVFCGWLCPFGALQELLAKLARVVKLPQWSPSYRAHRMLWPVKYVSLAVLALATLHGLQTMAIAAEIEPFKTVISLRMDRAWPFVAFALVVLAAGLFVERAYCRFVCPLGAVMAIGGRLRPGRFQPLKRRTECGSPCQLCAKRCPIQAIEPSGKINMDECFYCLDCQVIHNDANVCPPLVNEAKRNRKIVVAMPTRIPAAQ
jgi:transcriptional regulator of nitric oxide reductase/NAD-dependent dihydropyrimidine dehydrogenase PreA subunit